MIVVMSLFVIETITGFALFFAMGMLPALEPWGLLHSALGLALIPVYLIYQAKHFLRVGNQKRSFHYILGIATALSLLTVIISGLPILPGVGALVVSDRLATLIHVVSSFAFLICLAGHLVIVWRVTVGRIRADNLNGTSLV